MRLAVVPDGTALAAIVIGTEIVLLPEIAASEVELVQLTVCPAVVQFQLPLVKDAGALRPVGRMSLTVMVPLLPVPPVLVSVRVNVGAGVVCPTVQGPLDVLAIFRNVLEQIGTPVKAGAVAVALPALPWVAPLAGNLGWVIPLESLVPLAPPAAVLDGGVPPLTAM